MSHSENQGTYHRCYAGCVRACRVCFVCACCVFCVRARACSRCVWRGVQSLAWWVWAWAWAGCCTCGMRHGTCCMLCLTISVSIFILIVAIFDANQPTPPPKKINQTNTQQAVDIHGERPTYVNTGLGRGSSQQRLSIVLVVVCALLPLATASSPALPLIIEGRVGLGGRITAGWEGGEGGPQLLLPTTQLLPPVQGWLKLPPEVHKLVGLAPRLLPTPTLHRRFRCSTAWGDDGGCHAGGGGSSSSEVVWKPTFRQRGKRPRTHRSNAGLK